MSTPIIRVFAETAPTEGVVGTYQMTLDTPAPAGGLTVNFNTIGSTATQDNDYYFACGAGLIAVTSSSFTIAEGATTATLNLVATTDYLSESDETVQVNLTAGVGYELVSFLPESSYSTPRYPFSLGVADFNGDGRLDFALSNFDNSKVSIYLRNASNTGFDLEDYYPTEMRSQSIAVGDFNSDGKMDLAVTNAYGPSVSVLLRNADNTGFDTTNYATGYYTAWVDVGDFNGDGQLDLVATNRDSDTVSVLLRNADNTGFDQMDYATGSLPQSVTVADFNNDSKMDFAVANGYDHNISVFLRNADNTGFNIENYATGLYPHAGKAGDFNNDGKMDIVVINSDSNSVSVLLRNADNTVFDAPIAYAVGLYPNSISVGDFNNDNKLDIAVANWGSGSILILLRNADNTGFDTKVDYVAGIPVHSIATGDFNADGQLDLVASYMYNNKISVLLNDGHPSATLTITNNDAPVLTTPTAINYTDTAFDDTFATATGFLVANDVNGDALSYGISGGVDNQDGTVSLSHAYGQLTVITSTGEYHFVADDTAIEALKADVNVDFTVTVSDGRLIDSELLMLSINQVGTTESLDDDSLVGTSGDDRFNSLAGNDIINGGDGNDILIGNGGADLLIGGLDKDNYNLEESTAATDTLRIDRGDSLITSYDVVTDFALGTGLVNIDGIDKLDLDKSRIADDVSAENGHNFGHIKSHHISDGMIRFDDDNNYINPLTLTDADLDDVFGYLQANIKGNRTVAFICEDDTFVFQDGGAHDTVVDLIGVVANSINNTGLGSDAVWIV